MMGLVTGEITPRNVNRICRLCLETKTDALPFTEVRQVAENITVLISEMFKNQTTEMVCSGDGLPQLICIECLKLLEASYIFHIKYEESISIINNFLSSVKEEFEHEDNSLTYDNSDTDTKVHVITLSETIGQLKRRKRKRKVTVSKVKIEQNTHQTESETVDEDIVAAENVLLHPCPICPKQFTALELKKHARTHKALKKYISIPNEKKLTSSTRFIAEKNVGSIVSIFDRTGEKHTCPYCNKNFSVEAFRLHVDQHRHQEEYKCDECGRIFRKLNHLNTHRVKHLKEYPYKCEDCGKGFVIQTNYDCHVLTHNKAELPHECSYCLKRFSNPEHLNRHLIIHTENVTYSVKYKVCKCHHCLKTFKDRDELQSHTCMPVEQVTTTRYPCKSCKKVFKHSSGLYNHNRNIHKLKGAKTLCSVCGNYVSNIYNHMMRHSGDKQYHCNQCEKSFFTKTQLRQHLLVHSGLKPYVCSVCAKAFNNLYNLQVHERIHKGDRCHICSICKKGFLEKSYLKKHMHVHTKL